MQHYIILINIKINIKINHLFHTLRKIILSENDIHKVNFPYMSISMTYPI